MHLNVVVLSGNLTRDPELKAAGELPICQLRLANNTRRKNGGSGEWEDYANYFAVTVFGRQGESCAQYLRKGSPVAVKGELRHRRWTGQDGQERSAVDVRADTVQFLGPRERGSGASDSEPAAPGTSGVPADTGGFEPGSAGVATASEDDIPF